MKNMHFEQLLLKNQLCFPLYAASRKVINLYTPYFKKLDITYTQYIVFMVLMEEDGICIRDLGKRLYLDTGTLTPLLKKMESKGWILRQRSRQDERSVFVYLQEPGKKMIEKLSKIPSCMHLSLTLDEKEINELYRLLYKIIEN